MIAFLILIVITNLIPRLPIHVYGVGESGDETSNMLYITGIMGVVTDPLLCILRHDLLQYTLTQIAMAGVGITQMFCEPQNQKSYAYYQT